MLNWEATDNRQDLIIHVVEFITLKWRLSDNAEPPRETEAKHCRL